MVYLKPIILNTIEDISFKVKRNDTLEFISY